jgi:hypothetical protein
MYKVVIILSLEFTQIMNTTTETILREGVTMLFDNYLLDELSAKTVVDCLHDNVSKTLLNIKICEYLIAHICDNNTLGKIEALQKLIVLN